MNKNVEKTMSRALSATLALGVVSTAVPVSAKSATSYYNDAKKAVAKAKKSKTQSSVDAATKAIKTLKAKTKLDKTKKVKALEKTLKAAQTAVYSKVKSAVSKFKKSQNKADYNSAKKLISALSKSTIKAVKSSAKTYQKSLDAARATVKSVAAVADKTVALGTTADKLGLPSTVNVTLSNGTTTTANVAWDTAKFDGTKAADTTITGKLTVPSTKYYKATTLTASVKVTVSALEVTTVKADTAKSLQVTFNGPVADTSKVSFDVQKGDTTKTAVTGLTTTWNADKTVATLAQESNLTATTYTVTAKGDNVSATKNSGTVKVEAQKVAKIEFASTDLVKNSTATSATFTYKVTDQYGTDITSSVSSAKMSVSAIVGSTQITPVLTPSKGIGTIAKTYADTDKTAVVTIVNKDTGVNATATLNIVAAASVADLAFGTDKLPAGKTNIETGLSVADTIPVTAKDQYGNVIKDTAALNGALNIVPSNSSVSFSFDNDADGNVVLVANTSALTDKATVVLTLVNKTTGKAWSKTFDIVKPAEPYTVSVGDFNKTVIAAYDTGLSLPITVKDQFGNELTKDQIAAKASIINNYVQGETHLGNLTVDTDKNSKTYGTLVGTATASAGTDALIFNFPGGVATKTVEVKAARKITTVEKAAPVTLIQGAKTDVKVVLKDQYEEVLKNDDVTAANTNGDLSYKIEISKVSGDDNGISITAPVTLTSGAEEDLKAITVQSASNKTGSYKLTVSLLDSTSTAVSVASTTINVVKNNVDGLTYSVDDVPTLNGHSDHTSALATDAYARKINVTAKDASGNSYVINKDDIVDVKSDDESVAKAVKDTTSHDWYVGAADISAETDATKTATLTITINTIDGIKKITKKVTVSKADAKIQKLRVVDLAIGPNATTDVSDKTDKLTYMFADKFATKPIYVIGQDQYGVWNDVVDPTVLVNNTDMAPQGSFALASNQLSIDPTKAPAVTAQKDLKITLVKEDGSVQITANVISADALTAHATPTTADNKFTATTNYPGFAFATSMVDMDSATAGVQDTLTVNGLTYTVVVDSNTATVTVTGTAIAGESAKTKTIKVTDTANGASDTLNLNIPTTSANEANTAVQTALTITE